MINKQIIHNQPIARIQDFCFYKNLKCPSSPYQVF